MVYRMIHVVLSKFQRNLFPPDFFIFYVLFYDLRPLMSSLLFMVFFFALLGRRTLHRFDVSFSTIVRHRITGMFKVKKFIIFFYIYICVSIARVHSIRTNASHQNTHSGPPGIYAQVLQWMIRTLHVSTNPRIRIGFFFFQKWKQEMWSGKRTEPKNCRYLSLFFLYSIKNKKPYLVQVSSGK